MKRIFVCVFSILICLFLLNCLGVKYKFKSGYYVLNVNKWEEDTVNLMFSQLPTDVQKLYTEHYKGFNKSTVLNNKCQDSLSNKFIHSSTHYDYPVKWYPYGVYLMINGKKVRIPLETEMTHASYIISSPYVVYNDKLYSTTKEFVNKSDSVTYYYKSNVDSLVYNKRYFIEYTLPKKLRKK